MVDGGEGAARAGGMPLLVDGGAGVAGEGAVVDGLGGVVRFGTRLASGPDGCAGGFAARYRKSVEWGEGAARAGGMAVLGEGGGRGEGEGGEGDGLGGVRSTATR